MKKDNHNNLLLITIGISMAVSYVLFMVLAGTFTPLKKPTIAEEKQLLNDYLAKHALAFSSKIATCKFHNATAIICPSPPSFD